MRHFRPADAFSDAIVLDVTLEDLGKALYARLVLRVTGRHAVAYIDVADDVDRKPDGLAVAQTMVRAGADTAFFQVFYTAGRICIEYLRCGEFFVRVIIIPELFIEQALGPAVIITASIVEPALIGVVNEISIGIVFTEEEVGKEIVAAKTFKILTECTGEAGFLRRAFAVGKHQAAVLIAYMYRINIGYRIEPGSFFDIDVQCFQFLEHRVDRFFQCGIFAFDVGFIAHRSVHR